jgi:hypothetical protein
MIHLISERLGSNEEDIEETTSPTVKPITVLMQLNLAAVNCGTTIFSYDIESAFTITPVDSEKLNGKKKYVRVRSDIVKYFLVVNPTLSQYVTSNGDIVLELAYWMDGYAEVCRSFFELLDEKLVYCMGFKPTKADKCLHTRKTSEDEVIIVATHVDNLLVTTPSEAARVQFQEELKRNFNIKCQNEDISYLGNKTLTMAIYQLSKMAWLRTLSRSI